MIPILLAFKLGFYLPAASPFGQWFYISNNFDRKTWGPEIGMSAEYLKRPVSLLGFQGQDTIIMPAYFGGVRRAISQDLDVAVGTKYRPYDKEWSPYFSIGLKLAAVRWL